MYTIDEQLACYVSLFQGRTDVFARRWEKNEKSGYSPAYEFDWNEFMSFKRAGGTIRDFKNKKEIPLTEAVIKNHLWGHQEIGIYPLLDDNTSHFIVADFDGKNWKKEIQDFIQICQKNAISTYLERSRSGNGGHVWIFFEDAYPAYKSRKIILELVREALGLSVFDKEVSFDRVFPNQDYHSKKGFGNLIALPLNGKAVKNANTCFLDPESLKIISDQWGYLQGVQRISLNHLDGLFGKYTDENVADTSKNNGKRDAKHLAIILRNQIFLEKKRLHGKLTRYIRDELNFLNTDYLIKRKLGRSVYKTEKYFKTILESDNEIMIPRGFVGSLIEFCQENEIPHNVIDERRKLEEIKFSSKISLYGYQKDILNDAEDYEYGVIVAPPGSGKTVMGLELITRRKQPSLILVHRKQLLDQWIERIQSFLGIPKKDIGQISGGKSNIGNKVTVAMIQSLIKRDDLSNLKEHFGMIIVDECHHIPAKTFRETIMHFDAHYLYGLTATPKRKHNDEKLIFVYIGNIIANAEQIGSDDADTTNGSTELVIRETGLSVPFDYKVDHFQTLSKILVYDTARNKMIVEDILQQVESGKKNLILTERREHVDVIALYLKGKCETITITGEDSASKRNIKIDQIKMGHFQVLISTGQFFGEGIDIDNLDCLFLVYPFSFEGKLIQYMGRIQRSVNEKIIFDYRDKEVEYFERLFKQRKKHYKKLIGKDSLD